MILYVSVDRYVKVGDTVEQFDNLCEVQSDKASVTITSRYDGKIIKLCHGVDEIALVGKPLLEFDVADEEEEITTSSSSSSSSEDEVKLAAVPAASDSSAKGKVLTTPAVRRIAMENKVDLTKVPATGRQGRVLKGDVLEYLNLVPAGTNKPHPTIVKSVPIPVIQKQAVADRVEQLKGVRKIMFKSMTESLVRLRLLKSSRFLIIRFRLTENSAFRLQRRSEYDELSETSGRS